MFSCLIYHFQCATQKTIIASGMNFDGGAVSVQFAKLILKSDTSTPQSALPGT